jgi:hypothetical protein
MIASRGPVDSGQASNAGCSIKSCSERISLNPQWRSPDVERSYHSVPFGLSLLNPEDISRNRIGSKGTRRCH